MLLILMNCDHLFLYFIMYIVFFIKTAMAYTIGAPIFFFSLLEFVEDKVFLSLLQLVSSTHARVLTYLNQIVFGCLEDLL